ADVAAGERVALVGTATPGSADPVAGAATLTPTGGAAAVFTLPAGPNTVTLSAGSTGNLKLTSKNGTFDPTEFAVPTTSLEIKLGNAGDTLTIEALDDAFDGPLTITGGTGADKVTVNAKTSFDAYTVNGGDGSDRFTLGQMSADTLTLNGGPGIDVLISAPGSAATL